MLTLAQFLTVPDYAGFRHGSTIKVQCSMPGCLEVLDLPRHRVNRLVQAGKTTTYCSRRCVGQHVLEQATTQREGVAGRVCSECNVWTPLAQMTAQGRAKICLACRRGQPRNKFTTSRSQAGARGVSWSLSYEQYVSFWGLPCHYCGDALKSVHLDQVLPGVGYQIDNVVPCCWGCNRGKSDQTQAEFLSRCRRVSDKQRGHIE